MNLNKFKLMSIMAIPAMMATVALTGCKDDDTVIDPTITLETGPTEINLGPEAMGMAASGYLDRTKALKYVVRSNAHWTLELEGENTDWVQIHPHEGNGDGIFMVAAEENGEFLGRALNLIIHLEGQSTPITIPVTQRGAEPYVSVSKNITINGVGGTTSLAVKANVDWTCSLVPDPENDWLTLVSSSRESIVIDATRRMVDAPRTAQIAIASELAPEVADTINLIQYGPSVIFYDDFEWLSNYTTDGTWYDASSPKNMKSWSLDQLKHGWTSWAGPSASVNVYGGSVKGNGWLKLGKTNYTGTAVSPRLTSLDDGVTTDVTVSFVACPYTSGGNTTTNPGNHDQSIVYIGIYGPGEIVDANDVVNVKGLTGICNANWERDPAEGEDMATYITGEAVPGINGQYPVKKFTLVNYPNSKLQDVWLYPDPLDCPEAQCELTVRGVTNKTQIIIFGGGWDDQLNGIPAEKYTITGISGKTYTGNYQPNINRLFIDNFMVKMLSE